MTLTAARIIGDEMAVADAHPLGARPFARPQYIAKFRTLTDGIDRAGRAGPISRG